MSEFSPIIQNSLFAMVDLFLDYAAGDDLESQRSNLGEFIIDCFNLEKESPEYVLLQEKFEEEFENANFYLELEKEEVITLFVDALKKIINNDEIPSLILEAINEAY